MPLGSRGSIAVAVLFAAGLALPVAASACSTDEYLTAEERGSGLYDTTPPDYYAGSSAPHTHGEGGAPVGDPAAEPVKSEAPAESRAPKTRRGGTRAPAPVGETAQPAPASAPAAPAVHVAATAPVTAPVVTAPPAVVIEAAAARARAEQHAARAHAKARARAAHEAARREARAVARTQAFVASRTDRARLHFETGAPEMMPAVSTAVRDGSGWIWAWTILVALLVTAAARAVLLRRPPTREAVLRLDTPIGFDPVEAELQEILAQELARQADAVAEAPAGRL